MSLKEDTYIDVNLFTSLSILNRFASMFDNQADRDKLGQFRSIAEFRDYIGNATHINVRKNVRGNFYFLWAYIKTEPVVQREFVHSTATNVGTVRRHTQVYCDSRSFRW